MKLIVFAVILSCCLVHVYSDCSAAQVSTVQQQFTSTFNSQARLREFAAAVQQRYVTATPTIYPFTFSMEIRTMLILQQLVAPPLGRRHGFESGANSASKASRNFF